MLIEMHVTSPSSSSHNRMSESITYWRYDIRMSDLLKIGCQNQWCIENSMSESILIEICSTPHSSFPHNTKWESIIYWRWDVRMSDLLKVACLNQSWLEYVLLFTRLPHTIESYPRTMRGGGLGSRPKKMYGERLGDGVEYHLMKPTSRR